MEYGLSKIQPDSYLGYKNKSIFQVSGNLSTILTSGQILTRKSQKSYYENLAHKVSELKF